MEYSTPKSCQIHGIVEDIPPLDSAFLSQSTFGDDALKSEIIALFHKQLSHARSQIAAASTASEWRFVLHTLKGASAAVGAMQFAALTDEWERTVFPTEGQRQTILATFDRARKAFATACG